MEILNTLPDFTVFHIPRPDKKGGGIALFVRTCFNITKNLTPTFTSFEHIDITLTYKNFNLHLVVIYRPPPSTKNKLTTTKFFSEFARLTEDLTNCHSPLLITGDFNFHLDNKDNADERNFLDFLESANMTQHVTGSTHSKGHSLDLIITRGDENLVHDVIILPDLFSDHKVVTCKLDCPKPPASKIYVTYRSTKSLTADVLDDVIPKVSYVRDPNSLVTVDLTTLVSKYNTALEKIYNDLAPMKSRWITHRPHAPWYNDDLRLAKRIKRRAERMFRKTGLACNNYQKQLEFHKTSYYKSKIERAGRTKLFRTVDKLFQPGSSALPSYTSLEVWLKISTNSLSAKFNPLETNSRMQSTIQCNLNIGL